MARVSFHKRILLLFACIISCLFLLEMWSLSPSFIPSNSISPIFVLYAKKAGDRSVFVVFRFGDM